MKVAKLFYNTIWVCLIIWMLMSWIDIGFHCTVPHPTYAPWNLLIMFRGGCV